MRVALMILGAIAVVACQPVVRSDVARFSALTDAAPRTFAVIPRDAQSLEAASYANLISRELEQKGWLPVAKNPQIAVGFDYGIDNGQTIAGSAPIFGQTGGGTTFSSGSIYGSRGSATYTGTSYTAPTFGVVGSVDTSETIYNRVFSVKMQETASQKPVYEITVRSKGSKGNFATVAPCLIQAAFRSFPVQTTTSEQLDLPVSECAKQN